MPTKTSLLLLAFIASASLASTSKPTYIIHMDKAKIMSLHTSPASNSRKWYESIMYSISKSSAREQEQDEDEERETPMSPELVHVYENTMFGFSAKLTAKQLESLQEIEGFLFATRDEMLTLHTTRSPEFLGLESGQGLWSFKNMAADVIIGVIDTGIWPEHISFQDGGLHPVPSRWKGTCDKGTKFTPSNCNKKLIGAKAFFKGYEAMVGRRINETTDYRSARDSKGHGTHTASTAAGNLISEANFLGFAKGKASGMKYTARIAAYKACFRFGCATSDVLAAMDTAVTDGVDVLSLSLGSSSKPYYKDNIAIAAFGAVQNGVFVSCSAGNSGPATSTVGNVAPWIMTVAASYIDRSFPTTVKLGDGQVFKGASLYSGRPTGQLPLAYNQFAGRQGAVYCTAGTLNSTLTGGKIVICESGLSSRAQKGEQVKIAGGVGMLLLNTQKQGEELLADPHLLPATSLGASAAKIVKEYVASCRNPTATISFQGTIYGDPAPVMAAFSSRGPSNVDPNVIKPDITGPGVNILAAWPPNVSPTRLKSDKRSTLFNIISGTSMSCPHISGLAALLKSAHNDWSPAAIKSALMTTAYTFNSKGGQIADAGLIGPATPFAFGSGHANPERASEPGLVYDINTKDYINYLCSLNYSSSQVTVICGTNFSCPNDPASQPWDLNYPSFAVNFYGDFENRTIMHKRTVTNVGDPTTTYIVEVTEPNGVFVSVEPRVLEFQRAEERLSYTVSFTALGKRADEGNFAYGSLVWESWKHTVTSPIAVIWQ